ncbi:MAG: TIGR00341 family protein [Hadesarchaea archaeon]|nr:TIGR00341 family protein [Hadesarchaea archaeon]
MALRLIEMLIPEDVKDEAEKLLEEKESALDYWYDWISEKQISVKIVVTAEKSQNVLDDLESQFSKHEKFRLLLSRLDAIVPRDEDEEEEREEEDEEEKSGISREELHADISDKCELSKAYVSLTILSAIVAGIGLLRNDVAVIIGAMVIAPILGPNVGLSLSTTLADSELAIKSLKSNFAGIIIAFLVAVLIGYFLTIDPNIPALFARTQGNLGDIAIALAAGGAGAMAFTRRIPTAIVGVMVAIALLPTLVASGLLFGSGNLILGAGALILFSMYLICINLAGVVTFLVQGIEPRSWWEADKAKKLSRLALTIWITLLIALVTITIFMKWL